jgi:phosphoserine aminotransferase
MLDWHGTGMSFMEMSHRSKDVVGFVEEAEATLRRLLDISDEFAVLFVQGGAARSSPRCRSISVHPAAFAYAIRGSGRARPCRKGRATVRSVEVAGVATAAAGGTRIAATGHCPRRRPFCITRRTRPSMASNFSGPEVGVPLVADMSSTLLSAPIAVDRYDVIYAGAQKNIGPAGLTLLIVRRALFGRALDICPAMLNWQKIDAAASMLNTPPTYSIYLAAWFSIGSRSRAV